MRDQPLVLPFGSGPVRKFFLFVLAIFMALFALISLPAPTAQAQTAEGGAEWNGGSIVYNNHQYIHIGEAKAGDSHHIQEGSQLYAFIEQAPGGDETATRKAHIIYFAPGTDPPTAKTATFVTYDFKNGTYSNPTDTKTINISPQAESNKGGTSCDSGQFLKGIGWIVCPITNFLAGAMDWLFGILSDFLSVRPAQTNQENALFRAWSFMRNFANVAFVMGFLVVIYSQVSGMGISNYGIKKVLPRLIIAAILVNISYWICAVLIDVSNIAGYSIQDIFINMRNGLIGTEGNNWDVVSWESITGFVLSGGTAAIGATVGLYALAAGTVGAAIYMLLPILVGVVLAALIALLVMALRQAIITVLVVLSPLAFVAYILPNTEKHFEKWKDLFITMLVMFPLFSIIFGGSQLAGILIIQSADSINLIILGMAVQVTPIVVTPLLVRFSGSLIGRIAGMVNNPNKGLIDRTRNWSRQQGDEHKARVLANTPKKGIRGLTARRTQNIDHRRRKGKEWQKTHEAYADARWANSSDYRQIHAAGDRAGTLKERGEAVAQAHINRLKTVNGHQMQVDETNLHVAKLQVDVSKARIDSMHEEINAGHAPVRSGLNAQVRAAQDARQDLALNAMRKNAAERMQKSQLAEALENNVALQQFSGGIDPKGAQRSLAYALTDQKKMRQESIDNARSIIEHSNLDGASTLRLALGHAQGNITATDDIREAAIKKIGSEGNIDSINKLIEGLDLSPSSDPHHRVAFVEALKANSSRPKYVGFAKMDQITQGVPGNVGVSGLDDMIAATINAGKLSADELVKQDQDALARVADAIRRNRASYSQASLDALAAEIDQAFRHEILQTRIGERKGPLEDIRSQI